MQQQDSTHPTGVASTNDENISTIKARSRKAASALQMSLSGASWSEIAMALGFPTPRLARLAVERALEKELRASDDSIEKMRKMAGAKLDRLLRSVWPKAIDPDNPEHLLAVDRARLIIDRHAKLFGLDMPVEVTIHNPSAREIEEWIAVMLTAKSGQEQVETYDVVAGSVVERALPA